VTHYWSERDKPPGFMSRRQSQDIHEPQEIRNESSPRLECASPLPPHPHHCTHPYSGHPGPRPSLLRLAWRRLATLVRR
jgi:hypothetical protein